MKSVFLNGKSSQIAWLCFAFVLILGFQNCSGKKEEVEEAELPSEASPTAPPVTDCLVTPEDPSCLPTHCKFDGRNLGAGESIQAFQNSSVPFDSTCVSESRVCENGALTGSFAFASCTVAAPNSCLFDSQTIDHGKNTIGFQNSNVPFGSNCVSETRECSNGTLSGSFSFASCSVAAPSSCLFNGQTIPHGTVVAAFQSSTAPYGTSCQQETRVCDNGALTGSFGFASCNVEAPQSCLFNGQTVAHGQNVDAYQASTVAFGGQCTKEIRTCDNGILSGDYSFASCNVESAKSCLFDGQTIADGQNVEAFATPTVPYGSSCQRETRNCSNGVLSGTYLSNSCVVSPAVTCSFNGQTIEHSSSVVAYQTDSVPYGSTCVSESRVCSNGTLSGSFSHSNCTGSAPPAGSCTFNDQLILNGSSVMAFQSATVPYGTACVSQSRTCSNGTLSGTYTVASCSVQPPLNCSFNGTTVAHGSTVTAYKAETSSKGSCQTQQRSCTNGSLSGSFKFSQCN